MIIKPLSQDSLMDTITLAHKVFVNSAKSENPPENGLRASLHPEESKDFLEKRGIRKLQYYVAYDDKIKRVIGVIGQYEECKDPLDTVWVGWFCVDPSFRGKNLGEELLTWNMQNAREKGYKIMKLYTSDLPSEQAAQGLYDKLGFEVKEIKPVEGKGYNLLFRERPL